MFKRTRVQMCPFPPSLPLRPILTVPSHLCLDFPVHPFSPISSLRHLGLDARRYD